MYFAEKSTLKAQESTLICFFFKKTNYIKSNNRHIRNNLHFKERKEQIRKQECWGNKSNTIIIQAKEESPRNKKGTSSSEILNVIKFFRKSLV